MKNSTSIIIPTYGRSKDVIIRTIDSILEHQLELSKETEIVLIDQNVPLLELKGHYEKNNTVDYVRHLRESNYQKTKTEKIQIIHITGGKPSVTMAKNYGIAISTGSFLIFFDDDVIVHKHCLERHHDQFYKSVDTGFIGGREIVNPPTLKRSAFRECLISLLEVFSSSSEKENEFKVNKNYVGRIKNNSYMISNFDLDSDKLIRINGARGCNWATSKENVLTAGGFDEKFQGSAMREETDLYLRIGKTKPVSFYDSQAVVTHMRQVGGCDNISKSKASLVSKLTNELYFQRKHFSMKNSFYFLLRLLPLGIESIKDTNGASIYILFRFWFSFIFKRTNQ